MNRKHFTCMIENCDEPHQGKGMCKAHYTRWFRDNDEYKTERKAWDSIKRRCYSPKYEHYADYGGRGIEVCDEWLNSFTKFIEHVGKKPSESHSLDRIDTNGDYEPGNVRWATHSQQSLNRRVAKNSKSSFTGVNLSTDKKKWSVTFRGKNFGSYSTIEEAISIRIMLESEWLEREV